ncbi:hypothetical protein NAEGRDRAFT_57132 [Naegleria gruberi]|uniref:Uncharacterized protein n=1 Tax=Naegleria gruberi TaxID=5762 RepID=D2V4K9_NAEGR|nr:uncharacterized protein NAEGRDRAFT_57132 [Naegleria gruberi]EFC48117.1 hypothetical protein NAEGRDRAFT_57132 [Naegleria gruberi]|eukprot:XP_002680861.1 hypothetical protein NAEGRDRAFT_57132 [Naegleria gruberi strain NEG-M]
MGQPFPCYSESAVSRSEMVSNRMEARQEGLEHFDEPTMDDLLKYIEKCKKGGSTSTTQNFINSSITASSTKASISSPDVIQRNLDLPPNIETSAQPIVAVNSLPNMTSQNHHLLYPSSSFSNLRNAGKDLSPTQQSYAIHGINLEKSIEVLESVWDDDVLTSEERENVTLFKQTKRNFTGNEHLTNAEIQNLILPDRFVLDVFLSMNELTKESAAMSSLNIGLIFLEDFNTMGEEREGILPLALQVGTAVLFWSSSRHVVSNIRTHTNRRKLKLVPISKIEGTKKVSMALINIARVCCKYNGKHYYDESNCNSQHFVSAVLSRLNLDSVISNKYGYFEELKRGQYRLKYFYSKAVKSIIKETADVFVNNPNWIEEVATSLQVSKEEVEFIVNNEAIEFKSRAQLDIFGITISHLSIIGGFAKKYSLERSTEIENFWVSDTGREDYDFLHIYDMVFDAKSIKEPENQKYKALSKTSFFFFDDDAMVTGGTGKEIGELQKGYRITIPHRTRINQD